MAYCKASKWSHFRKAKIDVTIWVLCDYLGTWRISDRSYDSSIRIFVIKKNNWSSQGQPASVTDISLR